MNNTEIIEAATVKRKINNDNYSKNDLDKILEESLFFSHTEVEDQMPILWVEEPDRKIIIASIGNISTIAGKAKAGKTFATSAITAALLTTKKIIKFNGMLPGDKKVVLYIDTEQSKRDCKKVLTRIAWMVNGNGTHPENLKYVRFRGKKPELIMELLDRAIIKYPNIGAVVIDGVKDLIYSINSEKEATDITISLMAWSENNGIHIFNILHENKADGNVRGHIGTELQNKSESVITVEKSKSEKNLFLIKPTMLRDKDFEDFAFCINNNDIPEECDYNKKVELNKSKNPEDYSEDFHIELLNMIFPTNNNCSWTELNKILIEKFNEVHGLTIGESTIRKFNDYYFTKGYIINKGNGQRVKCQLNEIYAR